MPLARHGRNGVAEKRLLNLNPFPHHLPVSNLRCAALAVRISPRPDLKGQSTAAAAIGLEVNWVKTA